MGVLGEANLPLGVVRTGPTKVASGQVGPLRSEETGALVTVQGHGRFQEAVRRGNVYTKAAKSLTVTATTDISPLPATTGRALVGVFNPVGSGKLLVILKAGFVSVSGTPGGPFYLDVLAAAACTATNATTSRNNLSFAATGSSALAYAGAVPENTAVAVMLRPLGGPAASAVGAGLYTVEEDIGGLIILKENSLIAMTAHATGTSHVISAYITWEEVDA